MTIHDLDDAVIAELRLRAVATGQAVEEIARDVLVSAVTGDATQQSGRAARAAWIRSRHPKPPADDSTALIRQDRDGR